MESLEDILQGQRKYLRVPLVPINWGHGRPWGGAQSHLLTFFPDDEGSATVPKTSRERYSLQARFWNRFLTERVAATLRRDSSDDKTKYSSPDDKTPSVIAILGVPMDIGVGYRHGARFGPRAIREASAQFGSGVEGGFDVSQVGKKIVDIGDVDIHPYLLSEKIFNAETLAAVRENYILEGEVPPLGKGNLERIQSAMEWVLGEKQEVDDQEYSLIPSERPTWKGNVFPVILGGDHTVTLPCVRAVKRVYGVEGLGVVYFDAHPDYLQNRSGLTETHASQARRVAKEIGPHNVFQVGIRYVELAEHKNLRNDGVHCWTMQKLANMNPDDFSRNLFEVVKTQGVKNIYLSIDIDVLDAGIVPGTGVPEPGGMMTRYLIDIIQNLGDLIEKEKNMRLVALDLVEVAPDWDIGNVTGLAAVKLIFETLGAYFIAAKTRPARD